jgi:hypothetical protein
MPYLGPPPASKLASAADIASGAVDSDEIAAGAVDIAHLSASGTAGAGNYLRGDNSWTAVGGGPVFSFYGTAAQSNATGDGTVFTVVFGTEVTNVGSDFDGTSTFTADEAGSFILNAGVSAYGGTTSHTNAQLTIVTSNRSYEVSRDNPKDAIGTSYTTRGSVIADMDEGDTATVTFTVSGSTITVDIDNDPRTGFTGFFLG